MNIKKLSKKLPSPIKESIKHIHGIIPPRIRFGKVFWNTYNFLQKSQWWDKEKLEDYQMQQLTRLLNHAYENVPYYQKIFNERGLKPKHIQNFNDLKKLPYLTKDIFKQHLSELISKNVQLEGLPINHTSGTTGKPLQFYESSHTSQKELAFIYHQWSRVGVKPGDPILKLRGRIIKGKKPIEYNHVWKTLRFSPKIDSKETVHYYIEKMREFGARFLHCYPSTVSILASMIKKFGFLVPFKLEAVLFASETIYPWQREVTQEVFNCRIFSHYGQAEKVVLAAECEGRTFYHCIPQYSLVEIKKETKEIIGTSFLNHVNPFIRYQTTDVASQPVDSFCGECSRYYFPIFPSVEGRLEDYVITPDGIPISPAVITHPFKDFKTISNTQIIQKSLDCIKLKVVPWDNCDPKILKIELNELCKGLQNILGPNMKIKTEIVEFIKLSKSSKYKWIISEVYNDLLQKGII